MAGWHPSASGALTMDSRSIISLQAAVALMTSNPRYAHKDLDEVIADVGSSVDALDDMFLERDLGPGDGDTVQ